MRPIVRQVIGGVKALILLDNNILFTLRTGIIFPNIACRLLTLNTCLM